MNILFVYSSEIIPENGGVQRVTFVLKNHFESQDNKVFFLSLKKESNTDDTNLDQFFLPHADELYNIENISYYINLLKQKQVDIVINQSALGGSLVKFCALAKKIPNVKIISVIHNSLLGNVYNFSSSHENILNKIPIPFLSRIFDIKILKKILILLYIIKYKRKYIFTYYNSDKIVLLSENYLDEFKKFVPNCDLSKIIAIPNPCTIKFDNIDTNKEHEDKFVYVIYSGQLLDERGYPKVTNQEAIAIAYWYMLIDYKKKTIMGLNNGQLIKMFQDQYDRAVSKARNIVSLNQNLADALLDNKFGNNMKQFGVSYKYKH